MCGRRFSRQNGMMRHRNYEHATAKPAPAEPPAPAAPKLAPVPGPMERRPFDPDRVRANAANGI